MRLPAWSALPTGQPMPLCSQPGQPASAIHIHRYWVLHLQRQLACRTAILCARHKLLGRTGEHAVQQAAVEGGQPP